MEKNAIIAMSGGVDSAVAAWLMKESGWKATGVFLRLHEDCAAAEASARQACKRLGLRFYPVSAVGAFRGEVIDYFVDRYGRGETPNPCVACNRAVKFGVLLKLLGAFGAECLATGHYARIAEGPGTVAVRRLYRGQDPGKDQSYFLYTLGQDELRRLAFPLGAYAKTAVKEIAAAKQLPFLRKESQDLCFLRENGRGPGHNEFLKQRLAFKPGPIILLSGGGVIGEHQGLPFYTIGQRRGLEIGGTGPYYAVRADYRTNALYVAKDRDDPALMKKRFSVAGANWVSGQEPAFPLECEIQIRYRHQATKGTAIKAVKGDKAVIEVELEAPERAITPGQSAVFYRGDEVLGGGIIKS